MKKAYVLVAAAALAAVVLPVQANRIESVIAVDFLTVEVVMDDPLTAEELNPTDFAPGKGEFRFSEGAYMTGAPIPQEETNTYRIPVNGFKEDTIYTISYQEQKPFTFKVYRSQREMDEKYKKRFGDYF